MSIEERMKEKAELYCVPLEDLSEKQLESLKMEVVAESEGKFVMDSVLCSIYD